MDRFLACRPTRGRATSPGKNGWRRCSGRRFLLVLATLSAPGLADAATDGTRIQAVGVENEYADVIRQIGGDDVAVTAIETDPNTDPHTFEASPSIARAVASASLVVENGLGYDAWIDKILAAAPSPTRKVVDVQHLLGLPDTTPNPHLWYDPATMPKVAAAIAADLAALDPSPSSGYRARTQAFDRSLDPWRRAIAAFRTKFGGTKVAVTEPVADDMLQAAGCAILTPFSLQAAIMNGTDPSPQDITAQDALFANHEVKVFVYNQQVTDTLTQSFLALARKNHVPIVGVYETMPTPGFTYQSWMVAEVSALRRAVADGVSSQTLGTGR